MKIIYATVYSLYTRATLKSEILVYISKSKTTDSCYRPTEYWLSDCSSPSISNTRSLPSSKVFVAVVTSLITRALMGFIPEFYTKQETSLQLLWKKNLKLHFYLKNYLMIGERQIFQPYIKRAINQNSVITVLSVWLVSSVNLWKK